MTDHTSIEFLVGEKVVLTPPQGDDFLHWAKLVSDPSMRETTTHGYFPKTAKQQEEYYYGQQNSGRLILMIKGLFDFKLLGICSLNDLAYRSVHASLATYINKQSKHAPYASLEARSLLLHHAFDAFSVESVRGEVVLPGNEAWLAANLVLGFSLDGRRPHCFPRGGSVVDLMQYSITRKEFDVLVSERGGCLWPGTEKMKDLLKQKAQARLHISSISELLENARLQFSR